MLLQLCHVALLTVTRLYATHFVNFVTFCRVVNMSDEALGKKRE